MQRVMIRFGLLWSIACLLLVLPAHSQSPAITTLTQKLDKAGPRDKANIALQLASLLYSHDLDKGAAYARQSLELFEAQQDSEGIARSLLSLGTYNKHLGNIAAAQQHYTKALSYSPAAATQAAIFLQRSDLYRVQARFDSCSYFIREAEARIGTDRTSTLYAALLEQQALLANAFARNEQAIKLLHQASSLSKSLQDSARLAESYRITGAVFKDMAAYDSSRHYYTLAENLAQRAHEPVTLMLINLNRGETDFSVGSFEDAIKHYSAALTLLKQHRYQLYYAIALFKVGEVYENEGAYHTAYEYFYNAIHEYEKIGARQEIQRTYTQIGWCYVYQDNYQQALENARRSLSIARQIGDSASIGQNQNLVGYIHYKSGQYQQALQAFEQALAIRKKIQDWYGYSFSLYNSALTYLELDDLPRAHALFEQSLEVDNRTGKKMGILFTSNALGQQYVRERNFQKAAYYLQQANTMARQIPVPAQLLINYQHYISLYEELHQDKQVITYYKRFTTLKDSLSNNANSGRIAKADALFQLQKKANEIVLINQQNELHREQIKIQEREIAFQRYVITVIVIGICLLLMVTVLIFLLLRSNQRAKELLRKKNAAILEQQEEIQAQSEELQESNTKLYELNHTLNEKNEEIEVQSEKLQTAFEDLEKVNNSLEERVTERTQALNKAYEELETFFYHTSHDFRRPLTTYLGLVEVAKVTLTDENAIGLFEKVRETTLGLDAMLAKLQSVGQTHTSDTKHSINLRALLQQSVDKFAAEIQRRKIHIEFHCGAEHVQFNAWLLTVAIDNLIENAIRFCTFQSPCIKLITAVTENGVQISVEDNGQGIPEQFQPRIFEMYYRANASSNGNGLGLYITRRALEKGGATITFTSKYSQGSIFTISLNQPAAPDNQTS